MALTTKTVVAVVVREQPTICFVDHHRQLMLLTAVSGLGDTAHLVLQVGL